MMTEIEKNRWLYKLKAMETEFVLSNQFNVKETKDSIEEFKAVVLKYLGLEWTDLKTTALKKVRSPPKQFGSC